MPIEEIPREVPELVVRRPVKKGSYAIISYQNGRGRFKCKATAYIGSTRIPSFAPDLTTLDHKIVAQYEAEREEAMAKTRRFLDVKVYHPRAHKTTRENAKKTLRELDLAVPILSSVARGRVFALNTSLLLPTRFYTLGRVTGWEIFNT